MVSEITSGDLDLCITTYEAFGAFECITMFNSALSLSIIIRRGTPGLT
jgi:hypothetical protein